MNNGIYQYEDVIKDDNTSSVSIPSHFTIIDNATLPTQETGTATSDGDASGGQCTLTDTAATFETSLVSAGDIVHNTTDVSDGVVLSVTSETALVCALFGGTGNDWDTDDAYVIQPQGRIQIQFEPPPSTADHTVTVYYIQRPAPVFSDYGVYRFQSQYARPILAYAWWLYKYKDREPNYGDKFFLIFERAVKQAARALNNTYRRQGYKVNLKKRY